MEQSKKCGDTFARRLAAFARLPGRNANLPIQRNAIEKCRQHRLRLGRRHRRAAAATASPPPAGSRDCSPVRDSSLLANSALGSVVGVLVGGRQPERSRPEHGAALDGDSGLDQDCIVDDIAVGRVEHVLGRRDCVVAERDLE